MHQRAIKIKTDILGAYDYEVGLSIGHLASLYNYHMNKHREAEKLYLRSISISKIRKQCVVVWNFEITFYLFTGLKLFGESYSGLEYDYRGLCHVYESLEEIDKYLEYHEILETWKVLREGREEESVSNNAFNIFKRVAIQIRLYGNQKDHEKVKVFAVVCDSVDQHPKCCNSN